MSESEKTGDVQGGSSRRSFLKQSALAAGAASAFAAPYLMAADVKGANERIGVGFIGTGGRAQAHLGIVNTFQEKGVTQAVAVCDVYRPRLEAASRTTGGAKMYMEHEALLADKNVDVVCIATPDRHHAPQRIVPFGKGKKEILLPWKGQGDTSKLWQDLLDCVRTRRQPKCNIAMAVRVQAPLSMGILSHRESKVARFDKATQQIVLV